jgi:hypothetical protein
MSTCMINAKQLRLTLPKIVKKIQNGSSFTVLYRSKPAFRMIGMDDASVELSPFKSDSLYKAGAVGKSSERNLSVNHDQILYSK